MAKSQRASSRKRNNAALRSKIFGPATDARTERLSAKLQELASKPKPEEERAMDVDQPEATKEEETVSAEVQEEGERVPTLETCKMLTYTKKWTLMPNPPRQRPPERPPPASSPAECPSTASPRQRNPETTSSSRTYKLASSDRKNEKPTGSAEGWNRNVSPLAPGVMRLRVRH